MQHNLVCSHLKKQKDEVDCKSNKQSQQTHVVKIPCKVVLEENK